MIFQVVSTEDWDGPVAVVHGHGANGWLVLGVFVVIFVGLLIIEAIRKGGK